MSFRTFAFALLAATLMACVAPAAKAEETYAGKFTGKKVLYINSYHKGYEWSDMIEKMVHDIIEPSGAELRVQYMDTKNHQDEAFKQKAGLEAKGVIDSWKPDLVIVSDDNAVRYVVVPYFKNTALPFVFTGVNWDAAQYGLPCSNVTGMVEMDSADQMLKMLSALTPGEKRVAVLAADTETERQDINAHRKVLGLKFVEERYVTNFEDWKKQYVELQDKADILQLQNNAGISGWNNDEAKAFVLANTKIPTGSIDSAYMSPYAMVLYAKLPAEMGEWAARTALRVLGGQKISDIPLARNVKGEIFVNTPLVRKLGVTLPPEILTAANLTR